MLTHKTRPKLRKYLKLGVALHLKKNNKGFQKIRRKHHRFFSPKFRYLFSKSVTRFEDKFASSLFDRKKLKLLFGFCKTSSLKKILKKDLQRKLISHRFLKELEFSSLVGQRLDVVLFHLGFVSTLFEAKQLVSHKKFRINNKPISRSSYLLKKGDFVSPLPSIEIKIRKTIQEQLRKRVLYFANFSNIEINWKSLKFIILTEKSNLFCQLPHHTFLLNWRSISNL
jgi:ribosomal protein S4